MSLNPWQTLLQRIVERRKVGIVGTIVVLIWEQLERSISNLWNVNDIFTVYTWGTIEGRPYTLIKLTFCSCWQKIKWDKLLNSTKRDSILRARHFPRILILGPDSERFSAFIYLFHAAFRSCINLAFVKGFAGPRRLIEGEADGWGALGNSLGQSRQKKPWLLQKVLFERPWSLATLTYPDVTRWLGSMEATCWATWECHRVTVVVVHWELAGILELHLGEGE